MGEGFLLLREKEWWAPERILSGAIASRIKLFNLLSPSQNMIKSLPAS